MLTKLKAVAIFASNMQYIIVTATGVYISRWLTALMDTEGYHSW